MYFYQILKFEEKLVTHFFFTEKRFEKYDFPRFRRGLLLLVPTQRARVLANFEFSAKSQR
jgi:hypothetical protein